MNRRDTGSRVKKTARQPRKHETRTRGTRVQDQAPALQAGHRRWLRENLAEQDARYAAIVEAMRQLTPEREQWIAAFLERIQRRGYNVDGDLLKRVAPGELPRRRRTLQVVF